MKLSFSTIGCPDWAWPVIFSTAKDIGMDGIEVRCIGSELFAPRAAEFSDSNIEATLARLSAAGMCIPAFDSNAVLAVLEKAESAMAEARAYIDLAAKAGTPYVRLMCVGVPQPVDCDLELCQRQYDELCEYGRQKNVMPLLETNGPLSDSAVMRELMDNVKSDNKGVLWDVHHPYRYFQESPSLTYDRLGGYIRHIHIKDSILEESGHVLYRMLGKGDVPVKEILYLLRDKGFDGFVSLEWVKKWNPELEEAGVVFPNFARYVRRVLI